MPRRASSSTDAAPGSTCASPSRTAVSSAKRRLSSRLARKRTSSASTSERAPATSPIMVGTTTSVRASPGMPDEKSSRGRARGSPNQGGEPVPHHHPQLAEGVHPEHPDHPPHAAPVQYPPSTRPPPPREPPTPTPTP